MQTKNIANGAGIANNVLGIQDAMDDLAEQAAYARSQHGPLHSTVVDIEAKLIGHRQEYARMQRLAGF